MNRTWQLGLGLAILLTACGGGAKRPTSPKAGGDVVVADKLDPVKPEARRAFDRAQRALRTNSTKARDEARAQLQEALKLDPSLWEAHYNLGLLAAEDGDTDAAAAAYAAALGLVPNHAQTRLARAEALRQGGRHKDARDDYQGALSELAPDDPLRIDVAARLASSFRDQKSYPEAIRVLRDALRASGPSARIYGELGLVYVAQDKLDLATLVLSRALEINAKDPAIHNALALVALRQGKAQVGFERFDQATAIDPAYVDARFNKATVLLDAGDYGRAKAELQIVVDKAPRDLDALVAFGVAQRGLGDLKGAAATFDKVITRGARRARARADALYNLALLKADFQEDVAGAKAVLDQYLSDAPSNHAKRGAATDKLKELSL